MNKYFRAKGPDAALAQEPSAGVHPHYSNAIFKGLDKSLSSPWG